MTKKEIYQEIINTMETGELAIDGEIIIELCKNEIAMLDAKAERSKRAAAEKKAAGDPLKDLTYAALTEEPQTISDITLTVGKGDPEITPSKIGYRLRLLVNEGLAEKTMVEVSKEKTGTRAKTLAAYSLAKAEE